MAKARAIIKRRKAVQNIRKITRTMELIATARFRKALDRATEAEPFTRKIAELVTDLSNSDLEVTHPLLIPRPKIQRTLLLALTSNRGLAGGYNANVLRMATQRYLELTGSGVDVRVEVAGKRGISYCKFRKFPLTAAYTHFEDRPQFAEVETIANSYINLFLQGEIDQVDVVYTRFFSAARQTPELLTLLPMTRELAQAVSSVHPGSTATAATTAPVATKSKGKNVYEFLPDPAGILEELVPTAFRVRLFKCFLDAAVSEQISRRVAMKGATENADDMIRILSRLYNRARQSQITRELSEVIAGAAALE